MMKIEKDGTFWRNRAGKFMKQYCPFSKNSATCGDWCPLFSEPCKAYENMYITICQDRTFRIPVNKFIDNRTHYD